MQQHRHVTSLLAVCQHPLYQFVLFGQLWQVPAKFAVPTLSCGRWHGLPAVSHHSLSRCWRFKQRFTCQMTGMFFYCPVVPLGLCKVLVCEQSSKDELRTRLTVLGPGVTVLTVERGCRELPWPKVRSKRQKLCHAFHLDQPERTQNIVQVFEFARTFHQILNIYF